MTTLRAEIRIMKTQNILVVDDNAANRKVLRVTLEAAGLRLFEAWNGVEALAMLERQKVDAIISDILMPRMDGYRLCHEIRNHARLGDLPIIIHTSTFLSPGDEKLAFEKLISIPERAVHDPQLAEQLFPKWVEGNETVFTNTLPMRWVATGEETPATPPTRRGRRGT